MNEYDEWWGHLSTSSKLRIAFKVCGQKIERPMEATDLWLKLDERRKSFIKNHCEGNHGDVNPTWQDGQMYSE